MMNERNNGTVIITGIEGFDTDGNKKVRIYTAPEGVFMTVSWPAQVVQEVVDEGGYFPLRKSDERLITSCGRVFLSKDELKEGVIRLRFEKALKEADYASIRALRGRRKDDVRLASVVEEIESERNRELFEDTVDLVIRFRL